MATKKTSNDGTASKSVREARRSQSAKIQTALYQIADAASAVTDMQSFYKKLHEIVGKLMYAENFFIALYDEQTDLISWPYHADEKDKENLTWAPRSLTDDRGVTAHVIRTGQTIYSSRDAATTFETGVIALVGARAEDGIVVPMVSGGTILGAIAVQSYSAGMLYSEQNLEVLTFVAQHIATALTRARAIEETRQRNSELQIINSIQEGLAAKLDFQAIVDVVGDKLREIFTADTFGIVLYDPKAGQDAIPYAVNRGKRVFLPPMPSGGGISGYVLKSGQTLVFNRNFDAESQKYNSEMLVDDVTPKSGVYVPIMAGMETIGVVSAQNYEREDAYPDSTVRLLEIVAGHMGTALENARLFAQTQRLLKETEQRNAELAILNSVGEAMAKTLDVKTVTRIVGDKVRDIFSADQIGILLFEQQTNLIHLLYGYDKAHDRYVDDVQIKPIPLGKGLTSKVIESRQPLLLSTREEQSVHGHYLPPELQGQIKISESWLGVPIMAEENVLGVVMVEDYRPHMYNENHLRLLQTLSSNMGVAIQNARLFDETQQRNAELAIINSVQAALAAQLDIHGIYDAVGEKLREIFSYQDVTIYSADLKTQTMTIEYGFEKGRKFERISVPMNSMYEYLVAANKTFVFNGNVAEFVAQFKDYQVPVGELSHSVLIVPVLRKKDSDLAIYLTLQDVEGRRFFSDSDVRLLETLANSMSVALENARLWEQEKLYRKALQRELDIGREIQLGFLPEALPVVDGWEIAASLMSAREVAGDFYDAFELPDGNIGLVIADVCDKGVGAALFMTLFRSLIRAAANLEYFENTERANSPLSTAERLKRAMSLTNNYIAETHGESGMFATLFFGILDPRDGRLTYVNGGHEPPLILQAGGVRETLCKTGPAVGAITNCRFEILETQMQPGNTFFAFTDGVPDCGNPRGEFFGRERLLDSLQRRNRSAPELVADIESELHQYIASANQFDDITLLAVKRL